MSPRLMYGERLASGSRIVPVPLQVVMSASKVCGAMIAIAIAVDATLILIARLRENWFCVVFICVDFMPP